VINDGNSNVILNTLNINGTCIYRIFCICYVCVTLCPYHNRLLSAVRTVRILRTQRTFRVYCRYVYHPQSLLAAHNAIPCIGSLRTHTTNARTYRFKRQHVIERTPYVRTYVRTFRMRTYVRITYVRTYVRTHLRTYVRTYYYACITYVRTYCIARTAAVRTYVRARTCTYRTYCNGCIAQYCMHSIVRIVRTYACTQHRRGITLT
jgi:hypothetical protein